MSDTIQAPSGQEQLDQTGKSIFENMEIGLGAWAWGDRLVWGYGRGYSLGDLRAAFETSVSAGVAFFDTAEAYGQGQSETILGQFIKSSERHVKVATKFMPYPWRLSRQSLLKALRGSLKRLDMEQVDLYQIHMPLPPVNIETWMDALAEAQNLGLTRAVGVSNYDPAQTQRAYDRLILEGVRLASNQMEYSLLDRKIEKNGLIKLCKDLDVKLIAYSPLGMGILTGKYTPDSTPPGFRSGRFNRRFLERVDPLIHLMKRISSGHGGKTPAQVALNWVICKGAFPIPGAKTQLQSEQNAGAVGWRLSDEEVNQLDEMSDAVMKEV
jgi:aryl-alcohol dehydrogenase-like predicted oxidoreductase